jgi:hypothetical protein
MKYCKNTTQNHPISLSHIGCIEDINSLLLNEGYDGIEGLFVNHEVVLNLDCVEASMALNDGDRERNSSMDFTFGIANDDQSVKLMVLAELKLNSLNPNHIRREQLEKKVSSSKRILNIDVYIHNNFIFIFRKDKKEEAKSRFFRMNPRVPNEYIVMDLDELRYYFF